VVTQDASLADRVDAVLRDFETTSRPARAANIIQVTGGPEEPYRLHRGCHRVVSHHDDHFLLPDIVGLINQAAIAGVKWFAAHAAAVATDDRVVAFPAVSGQGKTTLAAAAVLDGFAYVTDEALVLDDTGDVVPYPKPLALSAWSCEKLGLEPEGSERLFTASELGGTVVEATGPLTDLVVARYGAESPGIRRLPSSQAMAELIEKSFNHYKDPERAFRLSAEVARSVRVWGLDYDNPIQAIELLRGSIFDA
jgi:hypothetical protein